MVQAFFFIYLHGYNMLKSNLNTVDPEIIYFVAETKNIFINGDYL